MAYLVNKTDGTILARIFDGQLDSPSSPTGHSSITLIGKQVSNYGEIQNENFVHIMENFSNSTSPVFPIEGQLWWNNSSKSMNIFNGSEWHPVTGFTILDTEPLAPLTGDQWWDTTNDQYKIYSGTAWILIGPSYSKLDGKSGAIVEDVYDTSNIKHKIIKMYHSGNVTAILSRDSEFTPNVAITGFSTVKPGMSFTNQVDAIKYYGTATNSDTLGNLTPSQYLRSDIDTTSTANVTVQQRLTIGVNSDLAISSRGGNVTIVNNLQNKNIFISANVGGVLTSALTVDGESGLVTVAANATSDFGIPTKQYVDVLFTQTNETLTNDIISNVSIINDSIANNVNFLQNEIDAANVDIALRATIASPSFTGNPTSITPLDGDSTNSIATTEFVANSISAFDTTRIYNSNSLVKVNVNDVVVTVSNNPVATFSSDGITTATQSQNDNSTKVATTGYVDRATKTFILNSVAYTPTSYVSQQDPNNSIGVDGDVWYRY